ncbi:MAG: hypothetical protein LBE12_16835 [Planctomycetaceae bacterium]|nr:hypothetical protein [Planctomycetaceae bacterium]
MRVDSGELIVPHAVYKYSRLKSAGGTIHSPLSTINSQLSRSCGTKKT